MSKQYNQTGLAGNVELSKGGPQLNTSGGALQARNNALSAYAIMRGLDGVAANDFITKGQLDAVSAGLRWKEPVIAATTVAITLATDVENGDTLDGVVLATGDRILVKDQTGVSATENGIYIVAALGAPARSADLDTGAFAANAATFVNEGTVNADVGFTCTSDSGSDIVGTDGLVWVQFASTTGGVTSISSVSSGGNDLVKSGTAPNPTIFGLKNTTEGTPSITFNPTATDLELEVASAGIVTGKLADDAVTEGKIAPLAVAHQRTVTFGFGDAGSTVNIGAALPANAVVTNVFVKITTAFNEALLVDIGNSATPDMLMADSEINTISADMYEGGRKYEGAAASTQLIVTVGSGSAPAAGAGEVVVEFVVTS